MQRCDWLDLANPLYVKYHDLEWGVPVHDDDKLFAFLILEGAQAGLSWEIILNKRNNYYQAFDNFDPQKVAFYDLHKQAILLSNKGIIRNRLKIKSAVTNAQVFLAIQQEFNSFDNYIWSFVNHKPIQNSFASIMQIPTETEISKKISDDLKQRGMKFVGPTIIYAFMQAIGMVNDHVTNCFRHKQIKELSENS